MKKSAVLSLVISLALLVGAFIPMEIQAAAKKPGKVKLQSVKLVNADKVKVTWKKAKNAKKYQVYRKAGRSKWKLVKTLSRSKKAVNTTVIYDVKNSFRIRAVNGNKKGKFSAVKSITIKSIAFEKSELSIESGETATLRVKNAVGACKWRSSDISVATVSGGVITTKKPGVTTITATNRGQEAYCVVYVNGYIDVQKGYDLLNKLRTTPGIWYWDEDDTTKIYFNKAGEITLEPLARHEGLEETARIRAKELVTLFDHVRPDGTICFTAFPEDLYDYGENIAYGQDDIETATEAWAEEDEPYDGQGHRRNMLSEGFDCVGIAGYMQDGECYWVESMRKSL